jgi:hypothetical protein
MRWLFLAILAGFGAYKLMDMFPRDPFPDQVGNYRLIESTTEDGIFSADPPIVSGTDGQVVRHMFAAYSAGGGPLEVRLVDVDLTAWSGDEVLQSFSSSDIKPRDVVRRTLEGVQFTCHTGNSSASVCVWSTSDWFGATITHFYADHDAALEVAMAVQANL